jgi:hypothetical protein
MASVGIIDYGAQVVTTGNGDVTGIDGKKYKYNSIVKHDDETTGFALSWPYEFTYVPSKPGTTDVGGKTTATIDTARVAGYVFGGGKGKVDLRLDTAHVKVHTTSETACVIHQQRYVEAFCGNVRATEVNIDTPTPAADADITDILASENCVAMAVYGGAEDGHVYGDATVNIKHGLIGYSVYGAGKGISKFKGWLRELGANDNDLTNHPWNREDSLYSWTAGKVYGNTTIRMSDGYVVRNICGGGYNGSVGKGNYASGSDDYYKAGYGEKINTRLFTKGDEAGNADFMGSGLATIRITGGTVGTADGMYDGFPTGQIYGGSRGMAAEDVGRR